VLRSLAAVAAILGLAAVLGGCGGGAKAAASCSLYSHRWKMYLVFRGRPVSPATCSKLGRDLGPVAFGVVKGQSNYATGKPVCVVHGTGAEADVYANAQAANSEAVGRVVCKFIKRAVAGKY
jgi:hypothetical protein